MSDHHDDDQGDDLEAWAEFDNDLERRHRLSQEIAAVTMEILGQADNLAEFAAGRRWLMIDCNGVGVVDAAKMPGPAPGAGVN